MAASLPEQLSDELEQAVIALDMEETYDVLERIADIQPDLADMLECVWKKWTFLPSRGF